MLLPVVYVEDPKHVYPERVFPTAQEYARVSPRFPKIAPDTIIIDRKDNTLYLAQRIVQTMKGWWNFGGSLLAREDLVAGARRTFLRDAGLDLPEVRFEFIMIQRIISAIRQEEPQEAGEDCFVFQFAVELTAEERERVVLAPTRYDPQIGLRAFDREGLVREARPPMVRFYDQVFR
ncbi:MAG: hypothetical protein Q8R08_00070 [bacterium]|nr:hypothetical protein [bacterium]